MTESKTYPRIQRSRKERMIFFPNNIQQIQKKNEEEIAEDFYEYDLIKIPDKGQQVEDYDLFKKENYAELRANEYGTWRDQFEIMQEHGFDAWKTFCQDIKDKYSK